MELSLLLVQQIIALFLMMIVGYVLVKIGMFKATDSKVISNIIVYVCFPCVIVNAFQIKLTQDKLTGLLLATAGAIIIHIILIGGVRLCQKPLRLNSIEKASVVYSNSGNLIVPLVSAVLGPEWVFYTTGYMMIQTILIWTHGAALIRQETSCDYKKIIQNPNIVAIGIAVFLFSTKIKLPVPIADCVSSFSSMVGPASMLVIGMLIGNIDLKWVFKQKRLYFICFLRLIAFPLVFTIIFCLTRISYLHKDGEYIFLVVLLAGMAPVAATVTQMAQIYDKDARYASVINVMSVIFCIITMPLMVYVYEGLSK